MASPESSQWLVGYGTFITRGTWKRYPSCRVCRVPGLRRVYDPKMAWFPFAIADEQAEMLATCCAGMSSSDIIVAVNKDPEAPIFEIADFGIVGDIFEIIPAIIDEIKRIQAER